MVHSNVEPCLRKTSSDVTAYTRFTSNSAAVQQCSDPVTWMFFRRMGLWKSVILKSQSYAWAMCIVTTCDICIVARTIAQIGRIDTSMPSLIGIYFLMS